MVFSQRTLYHLTRKLSVLGCFIVACTLRSSPYENVFHCLAIRFLILNSSVQVHVKHLLSVAEHTGLSALLVLLDGTSFSLCPSKQTRILNCIDLISLISTNNRGIVFNFRWKYTVNKFLRLDVDLSGELRGEVEVQITCTKGRYNTSGKVIWLETVHEKIKPLVICWPWKSAPMDRKHVFITKFYHLTGCLKRKSILANFVVLGLRRKYVLMASLFGKDAVYAHETV